MSPRPRYALDYYRRVKWFERNSRRFAGVVAPSEAARQRFLAAGFEPSSARTLPYFCSLIPAEAPRRLPDQPTVLFIGRVRPNKGVDTFLEAVARLPSEVRALMVGDFTAESREKIEARAVVLGMSERLEMRGWSSRDDVRQVFEEATVLAFPSLWPETLGIVGIEALACGVPAVASDIGGVREWLLPGETGVLVPPKDPVALAAALQELLFDESRNRQFGRNGIRLIHDNFSVETHIAGLLQIYKSCLLAPESAKVTAH
jgi:glycosyltransferase involved in cell wall biosynthesis